MATNTVNQVLTGFDATLMIDNEVIGRSSEFTVTVNQTLEAIYEQGTRRPVEIKEKKFEVTGTLKRMYIDQTLLQKVLGGTTYQDSIPYFDIQGYFKNPSDGSVKTITIQSAKIGKWDITSALEANTEEKTEFMALNVVIA